MLAGSQCLRLRPQGSRSLMLRRWAARPKLRLHAERRCPEPWNKARLLPQRLVVVRHAQNAQARILQRVTRVSCLWAMQQDGRAPLRATLQALVCHRAKELKEKEEGGQGGGR